MLKHRCHHSPLSTMWHCQKNPQAPKKKQFLFISVNFHFKTSHQLHLKTLLLASFCCYFPEQSFRSTHLASTLLHLTPPKKLTNVPWKIVFWKSTSFPFEMAPLSWRLDIRSFHEEVFNRHVLKRSRHPDFDSEACTSHGWWPPIERVSGWLTVAHLLKNRPPIKFTERK